MRNPNSRKVAGQVSNCSRHLHIDPTRSKQTSPTHSRESDQIDRNPYGPYMAHTYTIHCSHSAKGNLATQPSLTMSAKRTQVWLRCFSFGSARMDAAAKLQRYTKNIADRSHMSHSLKLLVSLITPIVVPYIIPYNPALRSLDYSSYRPS